MSGTTAARLVRPADIRSTWADEESDVTEEATYLGADGARTLSFLYRPTSRPAVGAVVICGSLYEDFVVNYRRELLVARALARRGLAVVRFHYRGFGNSDPAPDGAVTYDSMAADARAATAWLTEKTGIVDVVHVGARMGALLTADLASQVDGSPVVLWAPLASGADFFKGMSRASLLAGVRAQARKRDASASPIQRLRGGDAEMLGNTIRQSSYLDLESRTLNTDLGSRPVLFVQLASTEALTTANEALVGQYRAHGATVDVHLVRYRQHWTVPDRWEPEDATPHTNSILTGIVDWVTATTGATA